MEDIKAGEYVRTRQGRITRLIKIAFHNVVVGHGMQMFQPYCKFENSHFISADNEEELYNKINTYITKHSFNLMDLLETKDIVALEYYVEKYAKRIIRKFEVFKCYALIKFNNIHCDFLYNLDEKKWTEEEYDIQIKQILTHEQFETNCYKVEGDKESK